MFRRGEQSKVSEDVKALFEEKSGRNDDLYIGFMDDERNTDTAWVSVKCEYFHGDNDEFDAFELGAVENLNGADTNENAANEVGAPVELAWITLHHDMDLRSEHETLMMCIAAHKKAYW